MFVRTGLVVTFAVSISLLTVAEDPVFSGPQVGESLVPFKVVAVGGPRSGTEIDPIAAAEGKPTLLVFVHKLTRPGISLARGLSSYAAAQENVASGIVWLDDDKAAAEEYLNRAKASLNFTAPVGISVDGGEGPGAYGLNRNVELTILIANENKVTANFALVQPSVTEGPKIAAELAKLIDQPAPTAEQFERYVRSGAMRGQMRRARGSAVPQNELRTLMGRLVLATDDATFTKVVKEIDKWVGENDDRRGQLKRMASEVLVRGLGSEKTRDQLKQWQSNQESK